MFNKGQSINKSQINNSVIIQAGDNSFVASDLLEKICGKSGNIKLLNKLIRSELEKCRNAIYSFNFQVCRNFADTIINYGLSDIDQDLQSQIYFYRFLSFAMSDEIDNCQDCCDFLSEDLTAQINHLISRERLSSLDVDITAYKEETQVGILIKCFNHGHFSTIIKMYEDRKETSITELENTWIYFYSLSLFNIGEYEKASTYISNLAQKSSQIEYQLYNIIFSIYQLNKQTSDDSVQDVLREKLITLKSVLSSNPKLKTGNENLMISTLLQTALILGKEIFIDEYSKLSSEDLETDSAKYWYALYCEKNGCFQEALTLNISIKYIDDAVIYHRLLCMAHTENWEGVIDCYNSYCKINRNVLFDSIYIQALYHTDEALYYQELENITCSADIDIQFLSAIGFAIKERINDLKSFIIPIVKEQFDNILFYDCEWIKFIFVSFLLICDENALCIQLLSTIKQFTSIDRNSILEFCNDIYMSKTLSNIQKEKIADCFISSGVEKEIFLQIRINSLTNQKKIIDAINDSVVLYDLTPKDEIARNIIALVVNNYPKSINQYGKYYKKLELSRISENQMAAAAAYYEQGNIQDADRCAYNALLFLKDPDDFDFYESYVFFSLKRISEHKEHNETIEYENVRLNSVVTLDSDNQKLIVCIEAEKDTNGIKIEQGLEAIHVYNTDSLYHKLLEKTINDIIYIDEKQYRVESIIDKYVYAFRFATSKIENNQNSNGMVKILKITDDIHDLISQMQILFPNENNIQELFDLYHMENNSTGIPIEFIVRGNYDEYIDILKFLLYTENQALYAGIASDFSLSNFDTIVPTLSSLVILNEFNCLHCLTNIKDRVCIPNTFLLFVNERIERLKNNIEISPGKLFTTQDGQFGIIPPNKDILDVWQKILNSCLEFRIESVSDSEVAGFSLFEQMSGESFFNQLKLDRSQLECMILSKKEKSILLSDDLFYRRLASSVGVNNVNSGCLLLNQDDKNFIKDIIIKMSCTNYIYIPFNELDVESFKVVLNNISLGKYKKKHYSSAFKGIKEYI